MTLTARQRTNQKGYAIARTARRLFEARGAMVEPARNVVRWINGKPVSLHHDFFGVWDAIVVYKSAWYARTRKEAARRLFVQITTVDNMSHRRAKILESGFPCSKYDLILGYRGRGWFRVLAGPTFDGVAVEWKAPPMPTKKKESAS